MLKKAKDQLGIETTAGLVAYAIRNNLLDD